MALKPWEIQVLLLIAQDPKSGEAVELFDEFNQQFSPDAREMARQILAGGKTATSSNKRIVDSAGVFMRRANARNAERETRELAHAG